MSKCDCVGGLCAADGRADGSEGVGDGPLMSDFCVVELSEKEVHFYGAFRYRRGDFEIARGLLGRGVVGPVRELFSEVFGFEGYGGAGKATRDGKGIKNVIRGVGLDQCWYSDHSTTKSVPQSHQEQGALTVTSPPGQRTAGVDPHVGSFEHRKSSHKCFKQLPVSCKKRAEANDLPFPVLTCGYGVLTPDECMYRWACNSASRHGFFW